MANFSTDWPFWLAATLLGLLALFILYRSLLHNRSRGRRRCPKCWYDMSGADASREKGLVCPECGRDAKREQRLFKTHRRWGWAVVGMACLALSYGAWKAPEGRRHGWVRAVPTWALLLVFPHVLDLDEPLPANLSAAYERVKFLHAMNSSSAAMPLAGPPARVSRHQAFAFQVYYETSRRYFAGEMNRPAAVWLARWANGMVIRSEATGIDGSLIRRIAWRGWREGLVPRNQMESALHLVLRESVAVRGTWPADTPIALHVRTEEVASFAPRAITLVIHDLADRRVVRKAPSLLRNYPVSMITPPFWIAPEPDGELAGRMAGEEVHVRIELWSQVGEAGALHPEELLTSVEVQLPVTIVSSLDEATPSVRCGPLDHAIAASGPKVRRNPNNGAAYVTIDAAALLECIRRERITLGAFIELCSGDRVLRSEPILLSPTTPASHIFLRSEIRLYPLDGGSGDWRQWSVRLRAAPEIAILDPDGDRCWEGEVELIAREGLAP